MLSIGNAAQLAEKIYSNASLNEETIDVIFGEQISRFVVIDHIDTADRLTGGLEAVAVQCDKDIIIVVRGADVGFGRDIFKILNANDKFIPDSKETNKFQSCFQDWIWNGFLGTLGFIPMTQYDELKWFYKKIKNYAYNRDFEVMIIGHSLGGELAQRLSLEYSIRAITFSALSPWWSIGHRQRRLFRSGNLSDENIDNYYSSSDPFHYFPLFTKNLGKQHEVILKDYTSKSSLISMALERIYWAHGMKYYNYSDGGEIKIMHSSSKFDKILHQLNERTTTTLWVDVFIVLSGIVPTIFSGLLIQVLLQRIVPEYSWTGLNTIAIIIAGFVTVSSVVVYMLPTLIIHSRWKYIVWGLNLAFCWTGIGWVALLTLAFVLNSIAVTTSKCILD